MLRRMERKRRRLTVTKKKMKGGNLQNLKRRINSYLSLTMSTVHLSEKLLLKMAMVMT